MANRVLSAKARRLRMQNRSLPRRLQISTKGPRPSKEVLQEYRARARTLHVEESAEFFRGLDGRITNQGVAGVPAGRFEIEEHKAEILRRFDDPLFVTHIETHVQRIRIYFNSRQDQFIIQQMQYHERIYRISEALSNVDDAYFVLEHNCVPWKIEKPFPDRK